MLGRISSSEGRRHGVMELCTRPEAQAAAAADPPGVPHRPLGYAGVKAGQQLDGWVYDQVPAAAAAAASWRQVDCGRAGSGGAAAAGCTQHFLRKPPRSAASCPQVCARGGRRQRVVRVQPLGARPRLPGARGGGHCSPGRGAAGRALPAAAGSQGAQAGGRAGRWASGLGCMGRKGGRQNRDHMRCVHRRCRHPGTRRLTPAVPGCFSAARMVGWS